MKTQKSIEYLVVPRYYYKYRYCIIIRPINYLKNNSILLLYQQFLESFKSYVALTKYANLTINLDLCM